jgi:hypothetical protein
MEQNETTRRTLRLAWLRFVLGMLQMFGAMFSVVLLVKTGINEWSLGSVIGTGVITTISVILFGAKPFGILRRLDSTDGAPHQKTPLR